MRVILFPEVEVEMDALPVGERATVLVALEKLGAFGDQLPFSHVDTALDRLDETGRLAAEMI